MVHRMVTTRATKRRGLASRPEVLWLFLAALLAAPAARAQESEEPESTEPFFSVSSGQTYAPSGKPQIALTFRQVDHLDFRVYRVKDPFAFFSKLRDAHSLGSEKQELAREKTWLERFHGWKRDLRLSIRDFFRYQLSWQTRTQYRRTHIQEQKFRRIPFDVASFALVPLLNREQLVTSWRELVPKTRDSEFQGIPVDIHQKGLYLVEVASGGLRAYTLLMVTELALVSKSSAGQILLYVVRRDTGEPVADSTAVVLNHHQELSRGTTDATGVFEAKFGAVQLDNALMVAQSGDDIAATSVESFFFYDTSATEFVGYLYSDRPVYRPTHEVKFKGVLRARTAGEYTINLPGPVTVQVNDPHQKTIYQQKLTLSPFGSFNGKLTLNAFAPLGAYQIVAQVGDRQVFGSFEVEAYQKPEFEVAVTSDKPRYLQGETMQALISAKYYFGAPVANAQVKYSIYKAQYYFPYWSVLWGMEEYEGDEGEEGGTESRWSYYGEEIRQGTGRLDADGTLHVSVPTEIDEKHDDYRYRIEAHVTDASNHEIVGGHAALATYSTVVLLLDMDHYGYAAGDHAGVKVQTVDYDSQPVSTNVQLTFETRQSWEPNSPRWLLSRAKVSTDVHGVAHYDYTVPNFSWIVVRASAFDIHGREAKFETSIWVYGARWRGAEVENQRPEIYLDKRTYKPGETAHALIVTNQPGAEVLVTTEGQKVYTWSVRASPEGSLKVDIPIEGRFEPNFYVGVTFVKNEGLFEASKNVAVPAAEKVLSVTVETDKPQYKPNEKVTYTIQTRDQNGRPVSAEVSLGVVDEAIYAIQPDLMPALDKFFYARAWNHVYTQFSTTYWFSGYSGKNRIQLTFLRPPTRLADFKNAPLVQPKVRKFFPDTIFWAPVLVTDAAGTARATFTFPDSLTTWRATVRAVTKDTLVGQVVQKVITRKNLILRLEIPRFLTEGDTVTVTGIVHNYLDQDKTAQVSLEATGVELAGVPTSSVSVPKNGEAVVTWQVRAPAIGEADFVAKALTDQESDALELTAPVRPWGVQMDEALSGSLADGDSNLAQKIALPGDLNPDASSLRVDLAPSVAGALMSALDFLTSYPYGCVEQTMSSFLPNILVTKAVKELGLAPPAPSSELDKKIAAGLERLYRYQHEDGGWGWWETDETHPFMTAYVVAGLAGAADAGYPVDEDRLERGRESLILQIRQNPRALGDIRAYMLYGLESSLEPGMNLPEAFEATKNKLSPKDQELANQRQSSAEGAGQPAIDPAWMENLIHDRDKLSPYGLALMALTLARMKDPRAGDFVKTLEQAAIANGPHVRWKSERQAMLDFSEDNSFEATAYAVKAISDLDPKSPLLAPAAKWLMEARTDGYYWYSTEQTAMAIYGLIDYLKISGELKPDYTVSVELNGKKIGERRITEKEVSNPEPITLTAGKDLVHAGANDLRIVKKGPGVLYWSANATYFGREARPAKAGSTALNILREYFRLVPEHQGNHIVYTEQPLNGPVQSGEIVVVRLTVSSTSSEKYLEIEDPIPAGFEFVEQENLYELKEKPSWWDFYYTEREFFDDHAALFSETFDRGQGQFHYLVRAVEPGAFMANPARVLPMYEPHRQASTASATVTVTPR